MIHVISQNVVKLKIKNQKKIKVNRFFEIYIMPLLELRDFITEVYVRSSMDEIALLL